MQTQENKSSGDRLRAATTGKQVATKEPSSFPQMLSAYKDQIALALPKHMSGDRLARIALTCFRQNPKLGKCDPKSVFASVIVLAQLGLEPGIIGQAYLVPYNTKSGGLICQPIPGWQGLVDLVNRSGRASVWTGAVYKGDEFSYEYGSNPKLHHKPSPDVDNEDNPENLLYVYAIGQVKGSDFPVIEVWSNIKVRRHRDRYNKVGDSHYSYENFEMYARKVALLQVIKYMPKSIEMSNAISVTYGAEAGRAISLNEAIDGTFLPAPPEGDNDDAVNDVKKIVSGNPPEVDKHLVSVRAAKTVDELTQAWQSAVDHYAQFNMEIPIDLEAARNDQREAINQANAKAKG